MTVRQYWTEYMKLAPKERSYPSDIFYHDLVGGVTRLSVTLALTVNPKSKMKAAQNMAALLTGPIRQHFARAVGQSSFCLLLKNGNIRTTFCGWGSLAEGLAVSLVPEKEEQLTRLLKPLAPSCCVHVTDDDHYEDTVAIAEEFINSGSRLVLIGNIGSASERKFEVTEYRGAGMSTVHVFCPAGTEGYTAPVITVSPHDVGYCPKDFEDELVRTMGFVDPKPTSFTYNFSVPLQGYFNPIASEPWHTIPRDPSTERWHGSRR